MAAATLMFANLFVGGAGLVVGFAHLYCGNGLAGWSTVSASQLSLLIAGLLYRHHHTVQKPRPGPVPKPRGVPF